MFPSPCGEKVGINARSKRLVQALAKLFPSPCGEKVGINDEGEFVQHTPKGLEVSVPLRGKGRDQLHDNYAERYYMVLRFPSPCGEKVGINNLPKAG